MILRFYGPRTFVERIRARSVSLSLRSKTQDLRPKTWRYNTSVPPTERPTDSTHKQHRHAAYAAETTGLLLIGFLLLALTIIRYWHAIRWSVR